MNKENYPICNPMLCTTYVFSETCAVRQCGNKIVISISSRNVFAYLCEYATSSDTLFRAVAWIFGNSEHLYIARRNKMMRLDNLLDHRCTITDSTSSCLDRDAGVDRHSAVLQLATIPKSDQIEPKNDSFFIGVSFH